MNLANDDPDDDVDACCDLRYLSDLDPTVCEKVKTIEKNNICRRVEEAIVAIESHKDFLEFYQFDFHVKIENIESANHWP